MSRFHNAVFVAAAALTAVAMPAAAQMPGAATSVQCAAVSPGDSSREEFVVFFPVGSAALDPAARAVVERAARQATATFKNEICLIGRSSPTGSAQANQRLAQQRVQAVQSALVQRGVRRETLGNYVPSAFGAREDRAENRADRNVTIIFVR